MVFPDKSEKLGKHSLNPAAQKRLETFAFGRAAVYYDEALQKAHHIHIPGHEQYRLLMHHYG